MVAGDEGRLDCRNHAYLRGCVGGWDRGLRAALPTEHALAGGRKDPKGLKRPPQAYRREIRTLGVREKKVGKSTFWGVMRKILRLGWKRPPLGGEGDGHGDWKRPLQPRRGGSKRPL